MDNQSVLLNDKWRNYFNWTIIYPIIFFVVTFIAATVLIFSSIFALKDFSLYELITTFVLGFSLLFIVTFAYLIWFVIASDTLFALLGINRVTGNVLNIGGLIFLGGIPFLILPIFFWIKMRDHWQSKGQKYSWRAVAIN